jgi:hypothetical protein
MIGMRIRRQLPEGDAAEHERHYRRITIVSLDPMLTL